MKVCPSCGEEILHPARVSNRPFRERFEESSVTASEVAVRCGWVRKNGVPEASRVTEALGLTSHRKSDPPRKFMYAKNAKALCDALLLDPWEVGL